MQYTYKDVWYDVLPTGKKQFVAQKELLWIRKHASCAKQNVLLYEQQRIGF